MAGVRLDFFHAMDFGGSDHSEEKVYEVYILFELVVGALYPSELELPAISVGQVSPIFSDFTERFLELLRVYSYRVVP